MRKALKTMLITGALLGLGVVQPQTINEIAKHPGQTIKFEVKLEGQDLQKVKSVSLYLGLRSGSIPTDQSGFTNEYRGGNFPASSRGTFRPEITIPYNIASGDYFLVVSAIADSGSADYTAGKEFPLHDFEIDNPKSFTPPSKIAVKEVH